MRTFSKPFEISVQHRPNGYGRRCRYCALGAILFVEYYPGVFVWVCYREECNAKAAKS